MPSLEEARQLSGLERPEDILQFFMDLGCSTVVLKMGESGAIAKSRHGTIGLPAIPSLTLDATGAGDCFAAGFLRGLLEGWELEQCLRLGNAAGALCVRAIGATTGISTFDETLALIAPS
jgi:sugar/nucleoside kinase (ribokinase family)